MVRIVWFFALIASAAAAPEEKQRLKGNIGQPYDNGIKTDHDGLSGTWRVTSAVAEGKAVPKEEFDRSQVVWTFKNGRNVSIDSKDFGNQIVEDLYIIDPSKTPKTIDITYMGSEEWLKGSKKFGIYKLEKGTLTLCLTHKLNVVKESRPRKFEGNVGVLLLVLKRQQPGNEQIGNNALQLEDKVTQRDLAALKGAWRVISADGQGKPITRDVIDRDQAIWTFKDGGKATFATKNYGDWVAEYSYRIDPFTTPKRFEITYMGPQQNLKGQKQFGIYKLVQGKLTLCLTQGLGAVEANRPKEFAGKEGVLLTELERAASK